jgi:hypothetical protein
MTSSFASFPAIIVFAQELLPGKIGMVSGLFYGFAFGMGGIGAAVLGKLADLHGIEYVYQICAYLEICPQPQHHRRGRDSSVAILRNLLEKISKDVRSEP